MAQLAKRRPDLQFVLAAAPNLDRTWLGTQTSALPTTIMGGRTASVLAAADVGLVASGTATVEAAILGTPMVVVYRVSRLSYALGKPFVNVPHYAMVNLIAGRRLVPELIQGNFTPEAVAGEALRLLDNSDARTEMVEGLRSVRRMLGEPGASRRAALEVTEVWRGLKKLDNKPTSM
jgi:lipid-A-disaccharide synthase